MTWSSSIIDETRQEIDEVKSRIASLRDIANTGYRKCDHEKEAAKFRIISNGSKQYGFQCEECGRWRVVSKSFFGKDYNWTLPVVEFAQRDYQSPVKHVWDEIRTLEQKLRTLEDRLWWDCYEEYINSERWKKKRIAVIRRDSGVCQCCLSNSAEHVHHLKYPSNPDDFGKEPAFTLVSVCRDCHSEIHGREI